jgi:hypothetical protein
MGMKIVSDVGIVFAIGATFLFERVRMTLRTNSRGARRSTHVSSAKQVPVGVSHCPYSWIDAAEFARLATADPDLVVFCLIDGFSPDCEQMRTPGVVPVTVEELEDTLVWIPLVSRVAICRMGGVNDKLAKQLAAILHGRVAFLLKDDAGPALEKLSAPSGETR